MDVSEKEKPLVKDLNEHIICPLCRGYFVDATTLVECLHSFCRGCIVRRLSNGVRACPVCNVPTLPPLFSDIRLQRLVYLIVPGLFRSESEKRRHFRIVNPQCTPLLPPLGSPELTYDDPVSLSISEIGKITSPDDSIKFKRSKDKSNAKLFKNKTFYEITGETRYLKCPAGVTVRHLQRLLMLKRGWDDVDGTSPTCHRIEIMYEVDESETESRLQILETSWTLLDLACIFEWKNESPMKLYYCFVSKEESDQVQIASSCGEEASNKESTEVIENIQRPPTPPPSPKPISHTDASLPLEKGRSHTSTNVECGKEPEVKKPRCEVTPVMRAPDPPGNNINNNNNHHHHHHPTDNAAKPDKVAKLEHHKRRKRRNKRVIAEITTTPREDLLKLKVRLTPCPPRITSSTNNQTKEKLLQMRAVRREKIKTTSTKRNNSTPRDDTTTTIPENTTPSKDTQKTEESIEEIIDGIPDEIVKIAQNINSQTKTTPEVVTVTEKNETNSSQQLTIDEDKPKDEEVLRRLGLVAINETNKTHRDKMKISQNNELESLNREKLEQQLRESKANRVRSLLAEKQMRDALKSMMSNSKEKTGNTNNTTVGNSIKRKGPPPLAPLRSTKRTNNNIAYSSSNSFTQKCEIPLDLSSSAASALINSSNKNGNNILDLSPHPGGGGCSSSSSKGKVNNNSKLSSNESRVSAIGISAKSKDEQQQQQQQRKSQDLNLRTLSDAAVSLLSDCSGGATTAKSTTSETIITGSMNVGSSKVALRIPQPHQRISGFGMKIRPNLGIRHIPNPQAVVASQYRNQRAGFFNVSNRPS